MGHNPTDDDFNSDNSGNTWKKEWNRMLPLTGPVSKTYGDETATITNTDVTNILNNITTLLDNVGVGIVPIGGIIMWSGSVVPDGWKLCDGTPTPTSLPTPNLVDRFIVGGNVNEIGDGGVDSPRTASTFTLTSSNLPKHTHSVESQWGADVSIISSGDHTNHGVYGNSLNGSGEDAGVRFTQDEANRVYKYSFTGGSSGHPAIIGGEHVHQKDKFKGYVSPGYDWFNPIITHDNTPITLPIKKYYTLAFIMRYL